MAVANTVEATLRSKFVDGLSAPVASAISHTQSVMTRGIAAMQRGAASVASNVAGVISGLHSGLAGLVDRLWQVSQSGGSAFSQIGFAAGAMAVAVAYAFVRAAKAAAEFTVKLLKESSEVLELKLAFEGLTSAMGVASDVMLNKLRRATEGLVQQTVLVSNANRVLASGIPITTEQYVRLVENVFSLAKAAGTDGAQAIQTLTDALIRGNARGFQTIGLHINIKDAVSQMAEMMGQSASKVSDSARLQAFYNELIQETDARVRNLPPQFISISNALKRGEIAWGDFLSSIGQAIGRSGVLQQMFQRLNEKLFALEEGRTGLDELTLSANQFFLSALRGFADLLDIIGFFATGWNLAWGAVKLVVGAAGSFIYSVLYGIQAAIAGTLELMAKIPGPFQNTARELAEAARGLVQGLADQQQYWSRVAVESFKGWSDSEKRLNGWANSARALAKDLEGFAGQIIRGNGAIRQQGADAGDTAAYLAKLKEQLKEFAELQRELFLRTATPQESALAKFAADWKKIDELTLIGEEKRKQLRILAARSYVAEVAKIHQKASSEAAELRQQEERIEQSIRDQALNGERTQALQTILVWRNHFDERRRLAAQAVSDAERLMSVLNSGVQGKARTEALERIPQLVADIKARIAELNNQHFLTVEQINELATLQARLEALNQVDLSPFLGMLMRNGQAMVEAWAGFWADLVSGQEAAGKKFLAALINIVANEIMVQALRQTMYAIVAAASLDFAGAARHAAAAAALAALAGTLKGVAANLAQTNQASQAGSTFQQNVPRPTSAQQVQVIQVGAPGRAQNVGEATARNAQPMEVRLRVDAQPGFVVREVERDIRSNGRLRLVVQNA